MIMCIYIQSVICNIAYQNGINKNESIPFDAIDNKGLSKDFCLRLAGMDDFDSIAKMNEREFSKKIFVNSPKDELKFGLNNGAIWLIEESNSHLAAMFIIVPIENHEKLVQLEQIYGTATLAKTYMQDQNALDKPFVIFDAVIIDEMYRGLGFQRLGLMLAEQLSNI